MKECNAAESKALIWATLYPHYFLNSLHAYVCIHSYQMLQVMIGRVVYPSYEIFTTRLLFPDRRSFSR